jgi:hypothetical protein
MRLLAQGIIAVALGRCSASFSSRWFPDDGCLPGARILVVFFLLTGVSLFFLRRSQPAANGESLFAYLSLSFDPIALRSGLRNSCSYSRLSITHWDCIRDRSAR